jgi:serine phosphatase RsbU (regulator of sigma subunit)
MRSALRRYALETGDPADVLARLDRKMHHFEPGALATVLYAVFGPELEYMHISSAGHLPPVTATPGVAAQLADLEPDLMIGVDPDVARHATKVEIPPGGLLCFYTDGLIERPDHPIDEGLAQLCRAVAAQSPDVAAASIMSALVGSRPARDDIALLVLRRSPASRP